MVIDGKALAKEVIAEIKVEAANLAPINFAAVIVGENPASVLYVDKKKKACNDVGIDVQVVRLTADISQDKLNEMLAGLSADKDVHAILLQLPLPSELNPREAISHISPLKDVDGLTAENLGLLAVGTPHFVPCTALGILHILKSSNVPIEGADVCVIGRSNIVGKPTALLLMANGASVTLLHSKTRDLAKHTKNSDIVVVAVGKPGLLRADMIRKGAVVIDVGITRLKGGEISGDVDFDAVSKKAAMITPVPGGVGPLTIAFLLSNIVQARGKNV